MRFYGHNFPRSLWLLPIISRSFTKIAHNSNPSIRTMLHQLSVITFDGFHQYVWKLLWHFQLVDRNYYKFDLSNDLILVICEQKSRLFLWFIRDGLFYRWIIKLQLVGNVLATVLSILWPSLSLLQRHILISIAYTIEVRRY